MKRVLLTTALLVLMVLATSCETTPRRNLSGTMVTTPTAYPPGMVLITAPSAPDASTGSLSTNMGNEAVLISNGSATRVLRED